MKKETKMNSIVIKLNYVKQCIMMLCGLAIIAMSIFLIVEDVDKTGMPNFIVFIFKYIAKPIGVIGVLFFGLVFFYFVYNLFKVKDMLVLDSEGFADYSTMLSVGFVPWSNVASVSVRKITSQKFIVVEVKDRAEILSKLPKYKRVLVSMFPSSPLVAINPSTAKERAEDICDIMNKYKKI